MRVRSGGGEVATFLQLGVWVFTQTLQMGKKREPKRIKWETFRPQRNQLEARASLTEEETAKRLLHVPPPLFPLQESAFGLGCAHGV